MPFFFVLYVADLCEAGKKREGRFFLLASLPMLAAELAVLVNLFTHSVFSIDAALVYHRGGMWMLYAAAALYLVAGLVYFLCHYGRLPRIDRLSALILIALVFAGVAVQAVWSVPVELFFEAVAFFGFMSLLEHDGNVSEDGTSPSFRASAIIAIVMVFVAVIVVNLSMILDLSGEKSDTMGNIRLDVIRSDLQETVKEAENKLLLVQMGAEELLDKGASREELAAYFDAERERFLSDESFMNVFIAGPDWHIVPGFDAPPDFHAAERATAS